MFEIKYRIVDDFEDLKNATCDEFNNDFTDIFGFFLVDYNGNLEGYYHSNILRKDEVGQDMLVSWFELFMSVLENLNNSDYVAFREMGTLDVWYEFQRQDNEIHVNRAQGVIDNDYMIFEHRKDFVYPKWRDVKILFNEFSQEVLKKANDFIANIETINSQLLETDTIKRLIQKIENYSGINRE